MSGRHTYEVWVQEYHSKTEEPRKTVCVASFHFMLEALDYVDYCHLSGMTVMFRRPDFPGGENASHGKWMAPKEAQCTSVG